MRYDVWKVPFSPEIRQIFSPEAPRRDTRVPKALLLCLRRYCEPGALIRRWRQKFGNSFLISLSVYGNQDTFVVAHRYRIWYQCEKKLLEFFSSSAANVNFVQWSLPYFPSCLLSGSSVSWSLCNGPGSSGRAGKQAGALWELILIQNPGNLGSNHASPVVLPSRYK